MLVDVGALRVKIAYTSGTQPFFILLILEKVLVIMLSLFKFQKKKKEQQQLMTTKELKNTKIQQLTAHFI